MTALRRRTGGVATVIDRLHLGMGIIAGLILSLMMLTLVVDVVLRATTGTPLPGTVGFARLGLALMVYLSLPYTQGSGYNIRVELLLARLPDAARRVMDSVSSLVVLAISAFTAWSAVPAALRSIAIKETERGVVTIPVWPVRTALAVCALLLVVAVLRQMVWGAAPRPPEPMGEDEDDDVRPM